jgi:hypothetical protein
MTASFHIGRRGQKKIIQENMQEKRDKKEGEIRIL